MDTNECRAKIDDAREVYDALTSAQKALVNNYATLTDAEETYAALQAAAEQAAAEQAAAEQAAANRAAANAVIEKINSIGTVSLTAETLVKINAARTAYDALTDEQKALVVNYATLTQAETTFAELQEAADRPDTPDQPSGNSNNSSLSY